MNDSDWRQCLQACRHILGYGSRDPFESESWCAFTTFSSISNGVHYWSSGFPDEDEFLESSTLDGGLWRQAFKYSDLAHLIVPAKFYWERFHNGKFESGTKEQNINYLSSELNRLNVAHRITDIVLEIKLY